MTEIPEMGRAEALQEVARLAAERALAREQLQQATSALAEGAVAAAKLGASRTRIRELAGGSSSTFYEWMEAGGVKVRKHVRRSLQ